MTGQQPPEPAPVDTTGMADQPRRTDPQPDLLLRHASRTLDPVTAVRFHDQRLEPTVYAGAQLLVRPTADEDAVLARLTEVADAAKLDLQLNPVDERMRELAREAGIGPDEPQPLIRRVDLVPRWDDGPVKPPDAWPVLQKFRAGYPAGAPQRAAVQLDHVLVSHTGGVTGNPYWRVPGTTGNPYWRVPSGTGNPYVDVPGGIAEYAVPGFGGRAPVAWVGPEPVRRPDRQLEGQRRPVVALLDTGVGEHRWFGAGIVDRDPRCAELAIGLTDPLTAPESAGVRLNPLVGELDETAGHGTFIAGLIRQKCADAKILAIRVIQGDGVVAEADLLETLNKLWLRQKLAIINERPEELVDIVSMSLGYYHEEYEDLEFDPLLLAPIRALARLGVAVVVSSGNDATTRPMYPAAFAPYPGGVIPGVLADELPVVAVGASNPDRSVALFSNEGPWVRAHRPGAALVSTLPPFDGSRAPTIEMDGMGDPPGAPEPKGRNVRSTIDPDDFSSGFGIWSGTSFAAPILVGEVAQYLFAHRLLPAAEVDPVTALDRGWLAISDRVPSLRRPMHESAELASSETGIGGAIGYSVGGGAL
jgi:subtilisin family serine protease